MRTISVKGLLLAMSTLLVVQASESPLAFAGEGASGGTRGGGEAMVCRDKWGKIRKAWLLDLWEGENIKQKALGFKTLKIARREDLSPEQQADAAVQRVALVDQKYARRLQDALDEIKQSYQPYNLEVGPANDAAHYARPKDCKEEQLAYYTRDYGVLVQKEIWNWKGFSATDKAALLVHEAVYKTMREPPLSAKTSDEARPLVAKLFSDRELFAQDFRILKRPLISLDGEKWVCKRVQLSIFPADGSSVLEATGFIYDEALSNRFKQLAFFRSGRVTEFDLCGWNSHEYVLKFDLDTPGGSGDPVPFHIFLTNKASGQSLLDDEDAKTPQNDGPIKTRTGFVTKFYLDR
jgi:hypothetical protein